MTIEPTAIPEIPEAIPANMNEFWLLVGKRFGVLDTKTESQAKEIVTLKKELKRTKQRCMELEDQVQKLTTSNGQVNKIMTNCADAFLQLRDSEPSFESAISFRSPAMSSTMSFSAPTTTAISFHDPIHNLQPPPQVTSKPSKNKHGLRISIPKRTKSTQL
jgi:hypothetical protein